MDELDDTSGRNRPGSFYRTCCGFSRATVGGASQFEQVWLRPGSGLILNATFAVLCANLYLALEVAFMLGGEIKCVT